MSKTKAELAEIMALHGLDVPEKLPLKAIMVAQIKEKETAEHYAVDNMIRAAGHEVLRLPPYNCELNPIEMVWSQLKLNVRRRNQNPELSAAVVDLVKEEAEKIPAELWENCCRHAHTLEAVYGRELLVAPEGQVVIHFDDDDASEEEDVDGDLEGIDQL